MNATKPKTRADTKRKVVPAFGATKTEGTRDHGQPHPPTGITKVEPPKLPYMPTESMKTNPEIKLDQSMNDSTTHDKTSVPPPRLDNANKQPIPQAGPNKPPDSLTQTT